MTEIQKRYPEIGSDTLWSYVDEHIFKVEKKQAIANKLNYAFETNFSSSDPMSTMREFKAEGYEIHMVFMGLNSIEESIQRVQDRVRMGGHKVTEISIRYNFEEGLKNLYKHFAEFDTVTFYDNSITTSDEPTIPKEIGYITNGKLHLETENYPDWLIKIADFYLTG